MEYGLIGERLPHSFSQTIHAQIGGYSYTLKELAPSELEGFLRQRDFCGINVTIPYKQAVIPYLDCVSEEAEAIGAVNTVVNRNGKLYGYNTDIGGLRALINRVGSVRGEKVLILGTGGTAKTAYYAVGTLGAASVHKVSRSCSDGALSYAQAISDNADSTVIINTTPCGMYPNTESVAIDINVFPRLKAVVDVVYNPLRTRLICEAKGKGIAAEGGLYMLVKQAVLASELFLDKSHTPDPTEKIYKALLAEKESIVLTGMPASGKSTVGKLLAARLGRQFYDTDTLVEAATGLTIPEIFLKYGEEHFRRLETEAIKSIAAEGGVVLATGGGAVLKCENVQALKQNGHIYFLNRPIEQLLPTEDRPLASTAKAIKKRFEERFETYVSTADSEIKVTGNAENVANEIERRHFT